MKLLLDTNAYSAMRRGDSAVSDAVRGAVRVLMSAVVVGELLYGFRHGNRFDKNHERLERFLDLPEVKFLQVTYTTSDRFGRISTALRRQGRPIPTNDIWIAAHALEHGADLLSSDRHFDAIDSLVWIDPTA